MMTAVKAGQSGGSTKSKYKATAKRLNMVLPSNNPNPSGVRSDVFDDLMNVPLFANLPPEDVEKLLGAAKVEHCADNTVLFRQGEAADRFYLVLAGHVELYVETPDGRHGIVEIMKPGEVFAEAAIFDAGPYPVAARTFDRATLLVVPAAPFLAYLEKRFDLVLMMLGGMSLRLRQLIHQITELKLKSTAQRLGGFLLGLTPAEQGRATVQFPYDKKLVAEKLGMKPESLSRALAKLRRFGVSSEADNVAQIADIARLRRFCLEDDGE